MDQETLLKRDDALRSSLLNPEGYTLRVKRGQTAGVARLLVAGVDAAQVVVTGLFWSWVLPGRPSSVIGTCVLSSVVAMFFRRGLRNTAGPFRANRMDDPRRASLAVLAACCLLPFFLYTLAGTTPSVIQLHWTACWATSAAAIAALMRVGPVRRVFRGKFVSNVVVIGPQPHVGLISSIMSSQSDCTILAQLNPASVANMERLADMTWNGQVDKIVLAGVSPQDAERICRLVGDSQAEICLGFDTITYLSLNPGNTSALPLLPLMPNPFDDWRGAVKRMLDVSIVLLTLPLIMPVLTVAALLIRLESKGPILFRQWRFGLGSQPTQVLKFRTMFHDRQDLSGAAHTHARDPRVTRVGRILRRTSIDELPQCFNVLRGDMSLVGPRPHATHMKVDGNYYFEAVEGYRMRHRVKPGITGWAQVTGSRGEVDSLEKARDRLEKDLWYVRNWSLLLDFRIMVRTVLGGFMTLKAD